MRLSTILCLLGALAFLGCGDDKNDSGTAGAAGTNGEGGSGGGEPAMGPGCYSGPPNHMCDCSIAEADCTDPQIWTDTCPCGDANGEGQGEGHGEGHGEAHGQGHGGGTYGCYGILPNHMCDCEMTEAACEEGGGIWTDMCSSCGGGGHGEDHGEGHEEGHGMSGDTQSGSGGYGCYGILPNHMCDCDLTEEACEEGGGIWTDMCRSC